jgi:glycosyltransferase involved in cell wall biosynthesis
LEFLQRLPEYRLVIAGHRATPYGALLERRVGELRLTQRVSLPGAISDAQRQWLYEACEALVFPSLSEGFGLPVLEAMQCGRPVFLSRLTSLPEVGGPLACYWDSFDPDAMAHVFRQGLAQFQADPGYARRLESRAAEFSWNHTARAFLRIYQEILGGTT